MPVTTYRTGRQCPNSIAARERQSTKAKDAITGIESGFEQTGEDTAGKRESALGE